MLAKVCTSPGPPSADGIMSLTQQSFLFAVNLCLRALSERVHSDKPKMIENVLLLASHTQSG